MKITGSYLLPCSADQAWAALNDPEALKAALKGCEALERVSETKFTGVVAARIGPVSARFTGRMSQTELNPPHGCVMTFEGQGGAAGFAKGKAVVSLTPEDGGVRLSYDADAQVGGKLAQMGARLIEGVARSMADDFFGKFSEALGALPPTPAAASAGGLPRAWLWAAIGAAALIAIALARYVFH